MPMIILNLHIENTIQLAVNTQNNRELHFMHLITHVGHHWIKNIKNNCVTCKMFLSLDKRTCVSPIHNHIHAHSDPWLYTDSYSISFRLPLYLHMTYSLITHMFLLVLFLTHRTSSLITFPNQPRGCSSPSPAHSHSIPFVLAPFFSTPWAFFLPLLLELFLYTTKTQWLSDYFPFLVLLLAICWLTPLNYWSFSFGERCDVMIIQPVMRWSSNRTLKNMNPTRNRSGGSRN